MELFATPSGHRVTGYTYLPTQHHPLSRYCWHEGYCCARRMPIRKKRINIAPRYHREFVRRSYSRGYCSGRKSNSKHRLQTRQSKHLAVRGVQIFLETRGRVPYADHDMAPRRAATRRTGCWPAFFFLLPFFLCFSFSAGF